MKDKLDYEIVISRIRDLFYSAKYDENIEGVYYMYDKYVWVIGSEVLSILMNKRNAFFDQTMRADEPNTICGIPIVKIDMYNPKTIKLYREV